MFACTIYKQPLNNFMIVVCFKQYDNRIGLWWSCTSEGLLPTGPPVWFTNALCKKRWTYFSTSKASRWWKNVLSSTGNKICLFVYSMFLDMVLLFVWELWPFFLEFLAIAPKQKECLLILTLCRLRIKFCYQY